MEQIHLMNIHIYSFFNVLYETLLEYDTIAFKEHQRKKNSAIYIFKTTL